MDFNAQKEWAENFRNRKVDIDFFKPPEQPNVKRSETTILTPFGNTRVLVYEPNKLTAASRPVFINMHGGGFVAGSADGDDVWCGVIAERADCIVYNVDYRLAPEHKFPIAIEEVYHAALYIYENANSLDVNPKNIAIGGHSAGGNLATAVCLYNISQGNKIPFVYQIIDYAPLDLFTNPADKPQFKEAIPVELAYMFNTCYLNSPEDKRNPLVSPLFAESLDKMPPALIITAGLDALAKEAEDYAAKLKDTGIDVLYKEYADLPHGFNFNGDDFAAALDSWHLMARQLKNVFYHK